MATVQELLEDIDIRIPNAFTVKQKITWMNQAMRILFKYMNDTAVTTFTTVENQSTYLLPTDCLLDQILIIEITSDSVVTNQSVFVKYYFSGLLDDLSGNKYYDALNGNFGLNPIPDTTGYNGRIYFRKNPIYLSESNLSAVPEVNPDYQIALEYYVLSVIAKSGHNPDVELANNYTMEFNNIISLMFKDKMEKQVKNPIKKRENKWWR